MRYLDYAATTPVLNEVVEAMLPFLRGRFGNPSSVYAIGRDAKKGLEEAREATAAAVGAEPAEIVFTAGGTEADNLALKGGAFRARSMRPNGNHIITTAVEHHAVLHAAEWLEKQGFRVTFLPVDAEGVVDLDALGSALGPETVLVSIMLANNEVGTIQPLDEALRITRERSRALFHTDAVQALGKVALNLEELGVDMASFAAHKIGGPKGTGALYVRRKTAPGPVLHARRQERHLRSATPNVAGIVGMAAAAEIAAGEVLEEAARLAKLRDRLQAGMVATIAGVKVN